jgi:hypothetical protein
VKNRYRTQHPDRQKGGRRKGEKEKRERRMRTRKRERERKRETGRQTDRLIQRISQGAVERIVGVEGANGSHRQLCLIGVLASARRGSGDEAVLANQIGQLLAPLELLFIRNDVAILIVDSSRSSNRSFILWFLFGFFGLALSTACSSPRFRRCRRSRRRGRRRRARTRGGDSLLLLLRLFFFGL